MNFLDLAGSWDASLLFVLGGAVAVATLGFRFVRCRKMPVFDTSFEEAPVERIDSSLLIGSAIFGIGWGFCGYCPGPGIAAPARLAPDAFLFTVAFMGGSLIYRYTRSLHVRRPRDS